MKITIDLNQRTLGLALAFVIVALAGYFWGKQSFRPALSGPRSAQSVQDSGR